MMTATFFLNSIVLGAGLAMDAFSVSLANGMQEPRMPIRRKCLIAGTYGFFQFLMPVIGWVCVHVLMETFSIFQRFIPWIAFLLLCMIGCNMLREAGREGQKEPSEGGGVLTFGTLLLQGIATSIDALSVGFTIATYSAPMAILAALLIAVVTFVICMSGLQLGIRFGTRFAGRASRIGGGILLFIGIEILVRSFL